MTNMMSGLRNFALVLAAVVSLGATTALAEHEQTDPQYFKVANVAADDVLNIRAEPNGSSQILGSLKPNAHPVEVFQRQGDWGRIVFNEANGWVSMNFLAPLAIPVAPGTRLPVGLVCAGTEPFWTAEIIKPDELTFETPDGAGFTTKIVASGAFTARPNADYLWTEGAVGQSAAAIRRQICSDGMSDRDYPMSIDYILRGNGSGDALEGCCSLPVFEK